MLVLSRREGERIRIGDNITLTVVRCSGDKVRIGVDAPPEVLVLRGELHPHNREEGVQTRTKETESKDKKEPREDKYEKRQSSRFAGRRRTEKGETTSEKETRQFEPGFRNRPGAPIEYPVSTAAPTLMFQ